MHRRQLLTAVVGGLFGSLVVPRRAGAQQPAILSLHDRVSLVTSGGTNVVALKTPDGLVLVDSGAPDRVEALMAALGQLSPPSLASAKQPGVRAVFNTHWHLENTGGNDALRQAGAAILAHENTRLWMATPIWLAAADR